MPNCIQLARKSNPSVPVSFLAIDNEMCAEFGAPVNPNYYHHDWYGKIGMSLALGRSFDEILADAVKDNHEAGDSEYTQHTVEVIEWLMTHFVPRAWAER